MSGVALTPAEAARRRSVDGMRERARRSPRCLWCRLFRPARLRCGACARDVCRHRVGRWLPDPVEGCSLEYVVCDPCEARGELVRLGGRKHLRPLADLSVPPGSGLEVLARRAHLRRCERDGPSAGELRGMLRRPPRFG